MDSIWRAPDTGFSGAMAIRDLRAVGNACRKSLSLPTRRHDRWDLIQDDPQHFHGHFQIRHRSQVAIDLSSGRQVTDAVAASTDRPVVSKDKLKGCTRVAQESHGDQQLRSSNNLQKSFRSGGTVETPHYHFADSGKLAAFQNTV
jgi:hypothetical protein